jgi:OmpA-OmpF porin, OOP family
MAVSQFLRPASLIDAVKGCLTPDVVRSASSLVGESESSTRQALNYAAPSILGGLVNMVSTPQGASSLSGLIRDGGYGAVADNARSLFSGGSATSNMLSAGQQLLGTIFGGRSLSVAELVGKSGGVSTSSANKLLSLANALTSEKSEITGALPAGVSQVLNAGPAAVRKDVATETTTREPMHIEHFAEPEPAYVQPAKTGGGRRWLPLALAALAALALLLFLRGRNTRTAENVAPPAAVTTDVPAKVELPGGGSINVPQGSISYNLASFLATGSAADLPKGFVFDHLNFETASTQLTAQSVATVNDLAQVLKAYPNAQVELAGHTDSTGNPQANQTLSLDRANAVKGMLVAQGVGAERIATAGFGQDRPLAPNDTEEGRARNRRLELNVTKK